MAASGRGDGGPLGLGFQGTAVYLTEQRPPEAGSGANESLTLPGNQPCHSNMLSCSCE